VTLHEAGGADACAKALPPPSTTRAARSVMTNSIRRMKAFLSRLASPLSGGDAGTNERDDPAGQREYSELASIC
jgi:hypothetical protein